MGHPSEVPYLAKTKSSPATLAVKQAGRKYLSQQDVPGVSLTQALRVPHAIADNYGYKPSSPLEVAGAMDFQPTSGTFRTLAGAAIAYGLTDGGPFADRISITGLGMRIVRPTQEGDDDAAKREAMLKPRVPREFLQKYDRAAVPREDIARNVLQAMGVPVDKAAEVFKLIMEGAEAVGFVHTIKDKRYIQLGGTRPPAPSATGDGSEDEEEPENGPVGVLVSPATRTPVSDPAVHDARAKKVFITHGKNRAFVEPIRKLLAFGEMEAVVATERPTVSQPVPEKVMEDMRSCGAAIIHVEDELRLIDKESNEHIVLNPNVLIEIGASMALFNRRFILVVKEGVTLPSNLQGLYEVRYAGDALSGDATIKLLESINDMKKRPLPTL
jgi:predicted nucleotide-binding protein